MSFISRVERLERELERKRYGSRNTPEKNASNAAKHILAYDRALRDGITRNEREEHLAKARYLTERVLKGAKLAHDTDSFRELSAMGSRLGLYLRRPKESGRLRDTVNRACSVLGLLSFEERVEGYLEQIGSDPRYVLKPDGSQHEEYMNRAVRQLETFSGTVVPYYPDKKERATVERFFAKALYSANQLMEALSDSEDGGGVGGEIEALVKIMGKYIDSESGESLELALKQARKALVAVRRTG